MDGKGIKVVAKNSKAYHDYFIEDKYEAGIELAGTDGKTTIKFHPWSIEEIVASEQSA